MIRRRRRDIKWRSSNMAFISISTSSNNNSWIAYISLKLPSKMCRRPSSSSLLTCDHSPSEVGEVIYLSHELPIANHGEFISLSLSLRVINKFVVCATTVHAPGGCNPSRKQMTWTVNSHTRQIILTKIQTKLIAEQRILNRLCNFNCQLRIHFVLIKHLINPLAQIRPSFVVLCLPSWL